MATSEGEEGITAQFAIAGLNVDLRRLSCFHANLPLAFSGGQIKPQSENENEQRGLERKSGCRLANPVKG